MRVIKIERPWIEAFDQSHYLEMVQYVDEFGEEVIMTSRRATLWREEKNIMVYFPDTGEKLNYGHTSKMWAKAQVEDYLRSVPV